MPPGLNRATICASCHVKFPRIQAGKDAGIHIDVARSSRRSPDAPRMFPDVGGKEKHLFEFELFGTAPLPHTIVFKVLDFGASIAKLRRNSWVPIAIIRRRSSDCSSGVCAVAPEVIDET